MTIIKNTDDLIAVATAQAPSTACARCLTKYPEDTVFYGQFGATPNMSKDLWVLSISSPLSGKEWTIAVRATGEVGHYSVYQIHKENIPWGNWRGKRDGMNLLVDGTRPEITAENALACTVRHRLFAPDGLPLR